MSSSIIVQNPPQAASQLVLLFHGVGALPENMVTLGRAIADACPDAAIVSVVSPDPSDFSGGYQWFSVRGITEDNRPARVAEALPRFVACVQNWQSQFHIGPEATVLIGFSQGGIMALEATQQPVVLAKRVIGLSTRFGSSPKTVPWAPVTLLHGDLDTVIAPACAQQARDEIAALDGDVTLDVIPGLAHQINHDVTSTIIHVIKAA
jgi:phospholipase/carboxylesterase